MRVRFKAFSPRLWFAGSLRKPLGARIDGAGSNDFAVRLQGKSFICGLGAGVLALSGLVLPVKLAAQATVPTISNPPVRSSRVEIYGAYSYFHPVDAQINGYYSQPIQPGVVAGANLYFNRFLGAEVEGKLSPHGPNDCSAGLQAGPVARYQMRRLVPFAHLTAGGTKLGGPVFQPCTWGLGITTGVGLDYVPSMFGEHLAIRPIQADYEYNRVNYGPLVLPGGFDGGEMKMNAYRLSAGVVLRFGNVTPAEALGFSCAVTSGDAMEGEKVTGSSELQAENPKKKTTYTWESSGGRITGQGENFEVDTTGLAPGSYTVIGHARRGHSGEQRADCYAHFAVMAPSAPPTISCSANPGVVHPGDMSEILSIANSDPKRSLTYSYTASGGTIAGNGNTAKLNTAGVPLGPITVICNVVDDMGQSAASTATVQVVEVPLPPKPKTERLCSIEFERDRRRPARVDNEAKGCLDGIALTLQRQSDAKLVIVGSRDGNESPDVSAERTVNVKLYLVREKGIDPSRIQLRSGATRGRMVQHTLVPAGATFEDNGTTNVDESTVKSKGQPYAPAR